MMTLDQIAEQMIALGAHTLSIRAPRQSIPGDPNERLNAFWQVSTKATDFSLHWHKGKPKPTLYEALIDCIGLPPPPAPPPPDDEDLLV